MRKKKPPKTDISLQAFILQEGNWGLHDVETKMKHFKTVQKVLLLCSKKCLVDLISPNISRIFKERYRQLLHELPVLYSKLYFLDGNYSVCICAETMNVSYDYHLPRLCFQTQCVITTRSTSDIVLFSHRTQSAVQRTQISQSQFYR